MYQRHVFISHSWAHSGHYDKLSEWIFEEAWHVDGTPLKFVNTSVPKDDPIHNAPSVSELQARIYERIVSSNIVICPTGMYSTHSKWIARELAGATLYTKPLLAVNPWGQERRSQIVQARANETVGWNKSSIGQAIWRLTNA